MSERTASVLVCDDATWSLTGKINLFGVYANDIVIPHPELLFNQIVFYFDIQTGFDDPFHHLAIQIEFPGEQPILQPMPTETPPSPPPAGRTKLIYKIPLMVQQRVLRPGRIIAKIIHERGQIDAGGVWVVHPTPPSSEIIGR